MPVATICWVFLVLPFLLLTLHQDCFGGCSDFARGSFIEHPLFSLTSSSLKSSTLCSLFMMWTAGRQLSCGASGSSNPPFSRWSWMIFYCFLVNCHQWQMQWVSSVIPSHCWWFSWIGLTIWEVTATSVHFIFHSHGYCVYLPDLSFQSLSPSERCDGSILPPKMIRAMKKCCFDIKLCFQLIQL